MMPLQVHSRKSMYVAGLRLGRRWCSAPYSLHSELNFPNNSLCSLVQGFRSQAVAMLSTDPALSGSLLAFALAPPLFLQPSVSSQTKDGNESSLGHQGALEKC